VSSLIYQLNSILFNYDHLFNLRFAAKELTRNAKKCEKQEKEEKLKLTNALKVCILIKNISNLNDGF